MVPPAGRAAAAPLLAPSEDASPTAASWYPRYLQVQVPPAAQMPVEAHGLRLAEKNRPGRSGLGDHSGLTWGGPASTFFPLEQVGVAALLFSLPRHPLVSCAFPNAFTFIVIDLKITGQLTSLPSLINSHLLSGRLSFSCMNVTSASVRKLTSLIQNRKISVTEMPNGKH